MKGYVNGVGYERVKRGINGKRKSRINIERNVYSHQNDDNSGEIVIIMMM